MRDLGRVELLEIATGIAEEYRDDGMDLTLRQLYYQMVAGGHVPNSDKSYKRLGDTIGDARLRGEFEMDLVVDRGRSAGGSEHEKCKVDVDGALREAARYVKAIPHWTVEVDRWFGQPTHVSVWVEKQAMEGVFEGPCEDLKVGFFACKGYPSHSALWEWLQKVESATQRSRVGCVTDRFGVQHEIEPIEEALVLYFGDHDPDGWQIPRSAEETARTLADVYGLDVPPIRFERIALNMDQIEEYDPPPFPAKLTSSRYDGYVREHGIRDAWELDALRPNVLQTLIRDNVARYFDTGTEHHWKVIAKVARDEMTKRMGADGWLAQAME